MPDGSCRGKTDGVCHDVPLTSRGGMYAMYRMAPRTKDYTLWGSDNDRYHQYVVTTDLSRQKITTK